MTSIVGILCQDGVVIGADSSATFVHGQQFRTIEQPTEKIVIVSDSVIIAGTGSVGLGQRFHEIVKEKWSKNEFQHPLTIAKELSRAFIGDMQYTAINPGNYGAFVAFPCKKSVYLCEFPSKDFQPELKTPKLWYVSAGSAQPITDPFLGHIRGIFWQDGIPTVEDGIFAVTWTLEHAIEVNPGGVNGPARVAVLANDGKGNLKGRLLPQAELDQHRQNVQGAKEHLRKFRQQHSPEAAENLEIPKPRK